jgi:glucan 1,3-beta-glucosidase
MRFIKGVNLGGWLVLERWVTPSLFDGLKAWDEFSFCNELGNQKYEKIKTHRDTFITKDDFTWIADQGLGAVRIPVGYWTFGDVEPYVGTIEYLDFAMREAGHNNLGVVIDLHAAPGSQNSWKHSGKEGELAWHKDPANIVLTLNVIEKLAARYKNSKNLIGIELLNEPRWDIPLDVLLEFYQQGYERVRKHCTEGVAVIISDAFRPQEWQNIMLPPEYKNVWLDCHMYQVFDPKDKKLDLAGHINKAKNEWNSEIKKLKQAHLIMVGEWSMALNQQPEQGIKEYGKAQLATFSQSEGWFYWTYKTESQSAWNLRCMIEKELLNI